MTNKTDDCQRAFEEWFSSLNYGLSFITKNEVYFSGRTQSAWEAWKAAWEARGNQ